jgi:hypothetical protein
MTAMFVKVATSVQAAAVAAQAFHQQSTWSLAWTTTEEMC